MKILSIDGTGGIFQQDAAWHRISTLWRLLEEKGHSINFYQYNSHVFPNQKEISKQYPKVNFIQPPVFKQPLVHLNLLKKENYDIVLGNHHFGAIRGVLGKVRYPRIPLILDMHGGIVEEFYFRPDYKVDLKNLLGIMVLKSIHTLDCQFATHIFCVSRKMISYLQQQGISKEKMSYITNGVDLNFYNPNINQKKVSELRQRLGLEGKFVFGYIGGLHHWQGAINFLRAGLECQDRSCAFLIVGGKMQYQKSGVVVIPQIPRNEVPFYYALCDVLVIPRPSHPATEIAAPTKFVEYLAMGKPVLTTDVGDAPNFVRSSRCGVVIPDNKPNTILKGVSELKGKTNNELSQMGRNSRELAQTEFDWTRIGNKINKILKALREGKPFLV